MGNSLKVGISSVEKTPTFSVEKKTCLYFDENLYLVQVLEA
jgi:hypothetical protein